MHDHKLYDCVVNNDDDYKHDDDCVDVPCITSAGIIPCSSQYSFGRDVSLAR